MWLDKGDPRFWAAIDLVLHDDQRSDSIGSSWHREWYPWSMFGGKGQLPAGASELKGSSAWPEFLVILGE